MSAAEMSLFGKIARASLGRRGNVVAVLSNVYLDESGTHAGARVLCIAGYLFTEDNAEKFNAEMRPVYDRFGIPYFHTSEILGGKHKPGGAGTFDHLTAEQRDVLARIFIRTVRRRAAFGFGSTVNEPEYDRMIRRYGNMPSAYAFLLHQALIQVGAWAKRTNYDGVVAYFLEDGAKNKGDAIDHLYNRVLNRPEKREKYRFASFGLVAKDSDPVANAPDILSYQWYRNHERLSQGHTEPRKDLAALLRPQDMVADWADSRMSELESLVRDDFNAKLARDDR